MKWFRRIGVALVVLVIAASLALWWMLNDRPPMARYESLMMPRASASGPSEVRVTWLGVATILIEDAETSLLTDGFFSRPDKFQLFFGKISPDLDAITSGMNRARIGKLAAIIVNHSHYDHAMDAPEVAKRTGARVIGSESTANVARGWGLPESQLEVVRIGEPMHYGKFTVTVLPSRHSPTGFTGGEIRTPLKPPVGFREYQEGASYAVLVEHEGRSLLINASAGFEPGALAGVHADVVLLGAGGLGVREEAFRNAYWREVVKAVGARRVIPIHWDDFTMPAGTKLVPMPYVQGDFEKTMNFLEQQAKTDGVEIRMPRDFEAMDVWNALP